MVLVQRPSLPDYLFLSENAESFIGHVLLV
jgi:hypothetical protein